MPTTKPKKEPDPPSPQSPTPSRGRYSGYITQVPGTEGKLFDDPNDLPEWLSPAEKALLVRASTAWKESNEPEPKGG